MLIYVIGFIFISFLGTILHFTYDLSNHNKVVGLFSAVNESTWEHIKIAITPIFIWSLIDGAVFGSYSSYFLAKVLSIIITIIIIPLIYYSYTKLLKKSILIIDISSFYIAIFLNQITMYYILQLNISFFLQYISVIILFIIFAFYMILTLIPIENKLFLDPITKKYGLDGHGHNYKKKKIK